MNMKQNKSLIWSLVIMVIIASVYRVIPRPFGFAPQIALAIFGGAVIRDKRLAFIMPVLSMFISDLIYQVLFINGLTDIQGFYRGQWINYALIAGCSIFGILIKKINVTNVLIMSIIAPTAYFLVSNFLTWTGVGEYVEYPKTWEGLMTCYTAALPFYKWSVVSTVFFSGILFSAWYLITKRSAKQAIA
jgi:hypothetical protein